MDIVVKGKNVEVPEHYRAHVSDKLQKMERYDHKIIRLEVELFHERNRRQVDRCQRVEITCLSRGPVVRAEASAKDFYTALDTVAAKLDTRLRKAADRRRVHHGRHTPISVAAATAPLAERAAAPLAGHVAAPLAERAPAFSGGHSADVAYSVDAVAEDGPGRVVRDKEHAAAPMTIDDALFEMELVGHDFYLFLDKDSGRASVVYRRRGYDYGVIRLAT